MPWFAWVAAVVLFIEAVAQTAMVERPRKPKSAFECLLASAELGLLLLAVVALGTHYVG